MRRSRVDVGKLVRGEVTYTEATPGLSRAKTSWRFSPAAIRRSGGRWSPSGHHSDHLGIAHVAVEHDSLRAFNRVMRPHGAGSTAGVPTPDQEREIGAIPGQPQEETGPPGSIRSRTARTTTAAARSPCSRLPRRWCRATPGRSARCCSSGTTGEELGLLGSDWFTRHPTVPRDSIVAQLNMDMIGRGDATDVKGGAPRLPHDDRLSTPLQPSSAI